MVPKDVVELEFETAAGDRIVVEGGVLVGRPEMRLKKRWQR